MHSCPEKKDIYAQAGIIEYWVVDLKNLELKVFRNLVNNNYTSHYTFQTGQISPFCFPEIIIEVEALIN